MAILSQGKYIDPLIYFLMFIIFNQVWAMVSSWGKKKNSSTKSWIKTNVNIDLAHYLLLL